MLRILIDTYGCTLNHADSDIMAGLLEAGGEFSVERGGHSTRADHDYVIVNTCTVKNPTETRILQRLRDLSRSGQRVIVTGCMASANQDRILKAAPGASIVTTSNIHRIREALGELQAGKQVMYNNYARTDKMARYGFRNSVITRVPVSEGCLSACSFCETKFARGPLNSFSERLILKAVEMSVRNGAREIELTSQDMGAYGLDKGTNIAELLKQVTDIEGDFKVRVGMLNPEHLGKYLDELADAYSNGKAYRFIHLPVQAGSDSVLRHMKRNYTIGQFNEYVSELRRRIDGISIETDMIVGYPTETPGDFEESLEFVRNERPTFTNVSRFGARPHASASRLRQLANLEIKRRSSEMSRVARSVQGEDLSRLIGMKARILINEENDRSFVGRDDCYRIVALRKTDGIKMGDFVNVSITSNSSVCLFGEAAV